MKFCDHTTPVSIITQLILFVKLPIVNVGFCVNVLFMLLIKRDAPLATVFPVLLYVIVKTTISHDIAPICVCGLMPGVTVSNVHLVLLFALISSDIPSNVGTIHVTTELSFPVKDCTV